MERKKKRKKGTKIYKGEEIWRKIKKRGREKEEFDDQDRTEADTVRCMKVRVRGEKGATVISILNAIPRTMAKREREKERERRRTLQNFERPLCPDLIRMCILSDNHEDHLALSMMISFFFLFSRFERFNFDFLSRNYHNLSLDSNNIKRNL